MNKEILAVCIAALVALVAACSDGSSSDVGTVPGGLDTQTSGWVGAWGASPFGPYPLGSIGNVGLPPPTLFLNDHAVDQSFRMIVHPTIGGETIRIRLSNLRGDRPVTFSPVRVSKSLLTTGPVLVPGTDTPVLFSGQPTVTVPPGTEAVSDPLKFTYAVGSDLAISFHVVGESGAITWHALSFSTQFVGLPRGGDTTGDPLGATLTQAGIGWFFVSGVDVLAPDSPGTIVVIGDSITDGVYTVLNTRWPDFFAQRLQSAGINMGVLNEGISGNTVTEAASFNGDVGSGEAATERFERDVLQRPGVRSVVIFEGTNDLTSLLTSGEVGVKAEEIYAGIRAMSDRAHAAGLCVVVGTIMPRLDTEPVGNWNRTTMEPERQKLNALLRADTSFEGIADFDRVMGSPLDPTLPNPLYYSPDQLHPLSLGMQVMANAVPLEALIPPPSGTCVRKPKG